MKRRYAFLGLLLLVTLPVIIAALFSFPSADDFSNTIAVQHAQGSTFIARVASQCINVYRTWQGTYFGNVVCLAGTAIYQKLGVIGIRVEYIADIALFVYSIWFILFRMITTFGFKRRDSIDYALLSTAVVMLVVLDNYNIGEVFLWHTGLSMYTVPLSFGLCAIGLMLRQQVTKKDTCIACILAFFAVGGALDISAFVCGSLCILAFNAYRMRSIKHIRFMIVFACSLIGALVNVMAPGNYSRAAVEATTSATTSGLGEVLKALGASNHSVIFTLAEFVGDNSLLLLALVVLLMSMQVNEIDNSGYWADVNPIAIGVLLYLGLIIVDFPVHFGYHSQYYPIRCDFIKRVVVALFILTELNVVRRSLKIQMMDAGQYIAIYGCICLVAIAPFFSLDAITSKVPFKVFNDCYTGKLEKFSESSNTIFATLEKGNGKDVVIELDEYDTLGYMKSCDLSEDSSFWVNEAMAGYYRCKSVSLDVKNQ